MGKLHDYFEEKVGKSLILDDDTHVKLRGICHNLNEHAAIPYGCSILSFYYDDYYVKNFAFTEKDGCVTLYTPKEDLSFRVIKIDDYEQFGFVVANFLSMWVDELPTPEAEAEIKLLWKD